MDNTPSAEPPITITPASPVKPSFERQSQQEGNVDGRNKLSLGRPRGHSSASRRVSKILKTQVHRGQERISSISKIVAFGPRQGFSHLRKTTSAPGKLSQTIRQLLTDYSRQTSIRLTARAPTKHRLSTREGESHMVIMHLMSLPRKLLNAPPPQYQRPKHRRNGTATLRRTEGC